MPPTKSRNENLILLPGGHLENQQASIHTHKCFATELIFKAKLFSYSPEEQKSSLVVPLQLAGL